MKIIGIANWCEIVKVKKKIVQEFIFTVVIYWCRISQENDVMIFNVFKLFFFLEHNFFFGRIKIR